MQKTEVGRTSTPRIGVTLSDRRNVWVWLLHRLAVCRAGGRAVKITPRKPIEIGDIDALIAGGGDDISFQLDGTELNPNVRYDPDRDRLERDLLERAFAVGKPVLGVCRGAQMINLVRGGSLYQDLSEITHAAPSGHLVLPRKRIEIEDDSRLAQIMRCNPCYVNALHHQAVNRVGEGLKVVARDQHNIVQAVEAADRDFVVGVQWHPEMLPFSNSNLNLFKSLTAAVA